MNFQEATVLFFFLMAIIGFRLKWNKLIKEEKEYKDKKIRETIINNNNIDKLAKTIDAYNQSYKERNQ